MEQTERQAPVIAYFSMEVGIDASIPTYSGGLGALAADSLRSAADIGIPMVGVTLLYRKGHFRQHLDADGRQTESPVDWNASDHMKPLDIRARVEIEGRQVVIRPWLYVIKGPTGNEVHVYFLDTELPENSAIDQALTDYLYGGDDFYRLCQETVLGMGGIAVLRALGYRDVTAYHMNESHSSLLTLALLDEEAKRSGQPAWSRETVNRVRGQCVFTTHTPVAAGIDQFSAGLVGRVLGTPVLTLLSNIQCLFGDTLNMIHLALSFSRYINGVSMRHEEISRDMFPSYPINSITNGVHAVTWTSEPFCQLFDRRVPEWRSDNLYLRYAIRISREAIRTAHAAAKQALLNEVKRRGSELEPSVMTIGFARRMTQYKRPALIFSDLERLKRISANAGRIQIVCAGKAHPRDEGGKEAIRRIFAAGKALGSVVKVVFLEEYDLALGKLMCSGSDLWLNTPQAPYEASGTSGMKAALNGVPSFSVMDGWWDEGHVEGVTGWSIGEPDGKGRSDVELDSLYTKLESVIIPMFYRQNGEYETVMRASIALNGAYYNSQRMMMQYLERAYMPST